MIQGTRPLRVGEDVYITRPVMYQGRELLGANAIGHITADDSDTGKVRVRFDIAEDVAVYVTLDTSEALTIPSGASDTKE